MSRLLRGLVLLICSPSVFAADTLDVTLTQAPKVAYLESMPDGQHLALDLVVENRGKAAVDIDRIELSVFDQAGALLLRRFVDGNGVRPSIDVLGGRRIEPGERRSLFNPFPPFAQDLPVASLRFDLALSNGDGSVSGKQSLAVRPQPRRNASAYQLPLAGRQINYDGHDALGHHRRFDVEFAPIRGMGFRTNAMRYSYDFVPVDAKGAMYRGEFKDNAAWFGFGAPIRAIGDGRVVAVENGRQDDRQFDQGKLTEDRYVLFGNYVVIDHGDGEFGVYAHAKHGSVSVKVGEHVKRGQAIAAVGASGSAFFPHLHFQLQDGPTLESEGLPSYFQRFDRVLGARRVARRDASVDTGEIVDTK